MLRSDFNFELPRELIAEYPSDTRTGCRMLCLDGTDGSLQDRHFYDLKEFLKPGDLLVFNDTKVIPARMYAKKQTGGAVEILTERVLTTDSALVHMKSGKSCREGAVLSVQDSAVELIVQGREGELFKVRTSDGSSILDLMYSAGHIPLPPYIDREDTALDRDRYQTVYSRVPGAVAAPTAGLHFDRAQLDELKNMGVGEAFCTLHVGAGTFQPVREDDISRHHMHSEFVHLSKQVADAVIETHKKGGRVIAVGTTAVRSLESAAQLAEKNQCGAEICEFSGDTSIFIFPGYRYRVVDCLITNFHLPESTLIMLVAAFAGYKKTMTAYLHAVKERYHFFSYGDCMFIQKNPQAQKDLPPSATEGE